MKIELFDNKTDAKINYVNEEFTIEENHEYKAICHEGEFRREDINPIGTFVTNKIALISVTNKVGEVKIGDVKFRIRSKLGDVFFEKIKLEIAEIEKQLLISSNGISDSLALSHGQYIEDIALSLFLDAWKTGETHRSLRFIFNNPNIGFTKKVVEKELTKGSIIKDNDFQYLALSPQSLINFNSKVIPNKFNTFERAQTFDIIEMRFVKFFLFFCFNLLRRQIFRLRNNLAIIDGRLQKLRSLTGNEQVNIINQLNQDKAALVSKIDFTDKIKIKVNAFLKSPILKYVKLSENLDFTSLKIHNHYYFKNLLSLYLKMRRSFEVYTSKDSVFLDIDSLENLYEYYCFIKLLDGFSVSTMEIKSLIIKNKFGWVIDKSRPIRIGKYKNKSLTLYFKKNFSKAEGSFSQKYEPDYTIEFSDEVTKPQYFHLDAKYKTDQGNVKKEDIDKMHTYTHAIKNSLGSLVLFPGAKKIKYPCHDSIIGALICTPLDINNVKNELFSDFFPLLKL